MNLLTDGRFTALLWAATSTLVFEAVQEVLENELKFYVCDHTRQISGSCSLVEMSGVWEF